MLPFTSKHDLFWYFDKITWNWFPITGEQALFSLIVRLIWADWDKNTQNLHVITDKMEWNEVMHVLFGLPHYKDIGSKPECVFSQVSLHFSLSCVEQKQRLEKQTRFRCVHHNKDTYLLWMEVINTLEVYCIYINIELAASGYKEDLEMALWSFWSWW